jgi:hypothetical protein
MIFFYFLTSGNCVFLERKYVNSLMFGFAHAHMSYVHVNTMPIHVIMCIVFLFLTHDTFVFVGL